MNTKFFLLLPAFVLISLTSSSVKNNKKTSDVLTVNDHNVELVIPFKGKEDDTKSSGPADMQRHQKTNTNRSHSEEDGKHHHFHFHRLPEHGRKRAWLLVISKIILIISHVSVLLYVFLHSIH